MTMYATLILFGFISLFVFINGQANDDRNLPPVSFTSGRSSKSSFDAQFSRGRCPERFYQVGDECLYFSIDGKIYSWELADRICSRRLARILSQASLSTIDQPNMQPVRGARQVVLNTPEKTAIFRALFQEYNEQNYAVRLPHDYRTLTRCNDGQDDKWPTFCMNPVYSNATCFETVSPSPNDICLREVDCSQRYLRLACEFTLPGSPEIVDSKFRHCTKSRSRRRRFPLWAWIVIAVGGTILLIALIVLIGALLKRKKPSRVKKFLPEPSRTDDKPPPRIPPRRQDPAAEPMLVRPTPANVSSSDYLQPRPANEDNTANA